MIEEEDKAKTKEEFFPVRVTTHLIRLMDDFIKAHPELAIVSRNELARRAISEWLLLKEKELEGKV